MKTFATFCIVVVVVICLANVEGQSSQVYCGRRLADALAYWCSVYYEEKRSANSIDRYQEYKRFKNPKALGLAKRGVVDECCYQPCDLEVLLSYC